MWDIERFFLGELRPEEAEAIRKAVEASPELSAYLDRMREEAPARSFGDLQSRLPDVRAEPAPIRETPNRNPWKWKAFFGGPKLALGGISGFAMVLAGLLFLHREPPPGQSGLRNKGSSDPEIHIVLATRESAPEQAVPGKDGDTVVFRYRSSHPVHFRIWIREAGKNLEPLSYGQEGHPDWPESSRWINAPDKIILQGDWPRQEILLVAGHASFTDEQAREALAKPSHGTAALRVFRFPIQRAK